MCVLAQIVSMVDFLLQTQDLNQDGLLAPSELLSPPLTPSKVLYIYIHTTDNSDDVVLCDNDFIALKVLMALFYNFFVLPNLVTWQLPIMATS